MSHALNTRAAFLKCSKINVKELKVPSANLMVHVGSQGRIFENLTRAQATTLHVQIHQPTGLMNRIL